MSDVSSRGDHRQNSAPAPSLSELRTRRDGILRIAATYGAENVRIFGSLARNEADADSDVDLLVDIVNEVRGFAYFGMLEDLHRDLTEVLGRPVDVVDSAALNRMRESVLREAVPL